MAVRLHEVGLADKSGFANFFNQTQLAEATGMSIVHVNRMLKRLRARGLIGAFDTRKMSILNWDGLVEAGDFDAAYLHLGRLEMSRVN